MRPSGRQANEIRRVCFTPDFTRHAEGSVLAEFGDTRVLCTASVEDRVPPWLRGKNSGWVTGEYGMLPRSTHTRSAREAARGKQSGRTQEISRLIGRSLRAVTDLEALGERTAALCDGLQQAADEAGVAFGTERLGGMFGFFFSEDTPVRRYRQVVACDQDRFRKFFHGMLERGIYLAPSAYEAGFVSARHSDEDIAATVAAARSVMTML